MIPRRILGLGVTLGGLFGATQAVLAAHAPTIDTIVQSSQVPYMGEVVINHRTRLKVWHDEGDRRRQEVLAPAGMIGELVVDNGRTRWHYSPRTGEVDIAPSLGTKRADSEPLLNRNFRLSVVGEQAIAGRPTRIVDLRSIYPRRGSQRLWLDTATGLALRVERRDPEGRLVETSEFQSVQAPAKLPSDAFEFVIPPRAKVTTNVQVLASGHSLPELKTQLPFPVKMPGYLPSGFEVLDVHLIETKGVRSLHWRLSDGLDMLSLFQTAGEHLPTKPEGAQSVALGRCSGYEVDHGDHRMLCWKTPAGAFTLVGDLAAQELDRIAASTAP